MLTALLLLVGLCIYCALTHRAARLRLEAEAAEELLIAYMARRTQ